MSKISSSKEIERFLGDVKEQIQYKSIRGEIEEEIKAHIEDRAFEYMENGMEEKEAIHMAVEQMGDPTSVGVMLNEVRSLNKNKVLPSIILAAVLLGIAGNFVNNMPDWKDDMLFSLGTTIRNLYYFVWGIMIFAVIYYKGYTFVVKHSKLILSFFLIAGGWSLNLNNLRFYLNQYYEPTYSLGYVSWSGHVLGFHWLLLAGPVLALIAYKWKNKGKTLIFLYFILLLSAVLLQFKRNRDFVVSAILILFVSSFVIILTMISKELIPGSKKKLYIYSMLGIFAVLSIYGLVSANVQRKNLIQFFCPEQTQDQWEDSYNGVLMKELLSRAELLGPVKLTQKELINYGTGAWFFDKKDQEQIEKNPNYNEESVTLIDILPQHYHNNYRFAFWVLHYGWIPAIFLILMIMGIYVALIYVTSMIHNRLGYLFALSCTITLSGQMILYLLGNLGYQYGWFCTLPFISEGVCSITVNMILAGLILSAHRYDKVVRAENYLIKSKKKKQNQS